MTLLPTDNWMYDDSIASVAEKRDIDDYCNLSTLTFACIVNFLSTYQCSMTTSSLVSPEMSLQLWNKLQKWKILRPQTLCPLLRAAPTYDNPISSVIYTHPSSGTLKKPFYSAVLHPAI